ncbi:MAG: hypothetical protein SGCHY_001231 [Lobulomycetales sp.]
MAMLERRESMALREMSSDALSSDSGDAAASRERVARIVHEVSRLQASIEMNTDTHPSGTLAERNSLLLEKRNKLGKYATLMESLIDM